MVEEGLVRRLVADPRLSGWAAAAAIQLNCKGLRRCGACLCVLSPAGACCAGCSMSQGGTREIEAWLCFCLSAPVNPKG